MEIKELFITQSDCEAAKQRNNLYLQYITGIPPVVKNKYFSKKEVLK